MIQTLFPPYLSHKNLNYYWPPSHVLHRPKPRCTRVVYNCRPRTRARPQDNESHQLLLSLSGRMLPVFRGRCGPTQELSVANFPLAAAAQLRSYASQIHSGLWRLTGWFYYTNYCKIKALSMRQCLYETLISYIKLKQVVRGGPKVTHHRRFLKSCQFSPILLTCGGKTSRHCSVWHRGRGVFDFIRVFDFIW